MAYVHRIDLDDLSPNAAFVAKCTRRLPVRRALSVLRALSTPSISLPALLLASGCYALLTLTGVGPYSWQVKLCASTDVQARSCQQMRWNAERPRPRFVASLGASS